MSNEALIFGKNKLERIVSCEIDGNKLTLFFEHENGAITTEVKPNRFWLLGDKQYDPSFTKLEGNLHYQWIKTYTNKRSYYTDKKRYPDLYGVSDDKEAAMMYYGFTYYKGMKVPSVSSLSFDIESTGLEHNAASKVLLISNTFRCGETVIRKLFSYDEYATEAGMFDAWCEWVREVDPSIILGHNIYGYDLGYLNFCAKKANTELNLGRDDSAIKFSSYTSKYRKDGSQFYEYNRCSIYGREIVDTMFVAYKYDYARKYPSYALKAIVAFEGLEVKDRQFYDAGTIRDTYKNPEEWVKIKKYAEHDADDALALYDLMIPAYFYLTPSIPKSFTAMMYSASGSQINAFLVRSYLQQGKSVPKTTEATAFEGAISIGNPGIYKNVFKVDVASLYPSIMLQYEVHDKYKDPDRNFLNMVDYFTNERLRNKKLAKETGDRYYKDLSEAQKIIINSAYGMMGSQGLNFNSPFNAAFVTRQGRKILQTSIDWAVENGFTIVNGDTDSISISLDGDDLSEEVRQEILDAINALFPEKIRFEDDGYYKSVVVIKTKNYILFDGKKVKVKGSALKASMKEKALKEFINEVINCLLNDKKDELVKLYNNYIKEIYYLKDITRWSSKKTVTESVLNPERANEQKVLDALDGEEFEQGDKIFVYFDKDENLRLQDHWKGDHHVEKLFEKLYKTLLIFNTVIEMEQFTKFHLKNYQIKCKLADTLGIPHPEKVKRTRKPKEEMEEQSA